MHHLRALVGSIAVCLALTGCGGDGTVADDGSADAGQTQHPTGPQFTLESGNYAVTALTGLVDGCQMFDDAHPASALVGTTFVLTNDGAGNIGLGTVGGTPAEPSEGASCPGTPTNPACDTSGLDPAPQFGDNHGLLVSDHLINLDPLCTVNSQVENFLTLTADNTFTSSYVRTDSHQSPDCTLEVATCTTTWTWTLVKQ